MRVVSAEMVEGLQEDWYDWTIQKKPASLATDMNHVQNLQYSFEGSLLCFTEVSNRAIATSASTVRHR